MRVFDQKLNESWGVDELPQLSGNDGEISVRDITFLTNMFIKMHYKIPHQASLRVLITEEDYTKVINDFNFKTSIKKKSFLRSRESIINSENIYVNDDQTIIIVGSHASFYSDEYNKSIIDMIQILFVESEESKVDEFISRIVDIPKPMVETSNKIHLVMQSQSGLYCNPYDVTPPQLNIESNYNDDFIGVHKDIVKNIEMENSKGLILLHGEPGCGKTTYIRYLSNFIPHSKRMIFLPPNLADSLSSPNFVNFLINNPNSILVIEDAENVIKKRSTGDNQAISNVLNISDGLLSDVLKISIIATFNCDIMDIDDALLRRGRMVANYKFTKLEKSKAQKLSDELGFETKIENDKTLAEIYNQGDKDYNINRDKIGF